jgi:hypothetical protein
VVNIECAGSFLELLSEGREFSAFAGLLHLWNVYNRNSRGLIDYTFEDRLSIDIFN